MFKLAPLLSTHERIERGSLSFHYDNSGHLAVDKFCEAESLMYGLGLPVGSQCDGAYETLVVLAPLFLSPEIQPYSVNVSEKFAN
jgi:hypothetical protein